MLGSCFLGLWITYLAFWVCGSVDSFLSLVPLQNFILSSSKNPIRNILYIVISQFRTQHLFIILISLLFRNALQLILSISMSVTMSYLSMSTICAFLIFSLNFILSLSFYYPIYSGYESIHTHAHTHTQTHIYMHTETYICTQICIYISTHAHTCVCVVLVFYYCHTMFFILSCV